ncbi:hypothetical protein [Nocardia neocaledoniensis]|uniref:hypothetical protein n=1 Tax=Nocardia neocaledoniensis TaxID=236511 RepID=UPI003D796B2B
MTAQAAGRAVEFDDSGLEKWSDAEEFAVTAERIAEYAAATNDPIPAHRAGAGAPPGVAVGAGLEGFRSASLCVDRSTGRAVGSTVWSSVEELESSRQQTDRLRAAVVRDVGADVVEVAEFRLGFAHLRVPELV